MIDKEGVILLKKAMALAAAIMVLAGSMEASAASPETCRHQYVMEIADYTYITTSTHPVKVGNNENGAPVYATCLIETKWQHYKYVCACGAKAGTRSEKIYEVHSMHK